MKSRKIKFFIRSFNVFPLVGAGAIFLSTSASCSSVSEEHYKVLPTYTGQADILIALGIKPDYYPLQLDATSPFSYLTNAEKMMVQQSEAFKSKMGAKLRSMIPGAKGSSWWNQFALNSGEKGSDPEYWTHISGDLTLYERYLLDDGVKAIESSVAPKHYATPESFLETNFRNSRDPFTRIPEEIMHALFDAPDFKGLSDVTKQKVVTDILDAARQAEGVATDGALAADGKALPSGKALNELDDATSWLYNDYVFAKNWHNNFLENTKFNNTSFGQAFTGTDGVPRTWFIDSLKDWVFSSEASENLALEKLFYASTFSDAEKSLSDLIAKRAAAQTRAARSVLTKKVTPLYHHPIYEQQEDIGSAPMFEGAMRDNMLYLYDIALKLSTAFNPGTSPTAGQQLLQRLFTDDSRMANFKSALTNAEKIFTEMRLRMDKFKVIASKLGNPTFGLVTIAPGAGSSTIQTSSKFGFIYREMGFSQPTPLNLFELARDPMTNAARGGSIFNMDDNGWWWNLSSETELLHLDAVQEFKNKFDFGILNVRDIQWSNLKNVDTKALYELWKPEASVNSVQSLNEQRYDYDLWNEGLKSPFGMHMILDQFLDRLMARYGTDTRVATSDWQAAKDWGSYFTTDFVK